MIGVKRLLKATAAMGLAATGLAATGVAATAQAATVKSVSVEPVGGDVRVVISFDDRFDAPSTFALDAPRRLVVDLPGNRTDTRRYDGQGVVTAARTAQFASDKARLVIDLDAPMSIADATAADGKLVLTLRPTDATAFAKLTRGRSKLPGIEAPKPLESAKVESAKVESAKVEIAKAEAPRTETPARKPEPVTVVAAAVRKPEPTPAPAAVRPPADKPVARIALAKTDPRPAAARSTPVRTARAGFRPLVVIDAGHGGHDTGALSVVDQKREKDVTLAIARAVQRELESSGRVRVMLTRGDDRFLPLPQRVAIAQRAKANLFISIHADSAPVPEARGATVYTLSEVASDREAARLAAKENKSDILAGFNVPLDNVDVADILIDLAQRETMNVSASFAAVLQREMSPRVHFKSNAHRFAGFRVLKAADVPSVLLETGYLSNEQDASFLFSKAGQQAIAEGVSRAVEAHLVRHLAQR